MDASTGHKRATSTPKTHRSDSRKREKYESHTMEYTGVVPITPMPNFNEMDTPEVQHHAQKYGLKKRLGKTKLRTKLKEVYLYTHQTYSPHGAESAQKESPIKLNQNDSLAASNESNDLVMLDMSNGDISVDCGKTEAQEISVANLAMPLPSGNHFGAISATNIINGIDSVLPRNAHSPCCTNISTSTEKLNRKIADSNEVISLLDSSAEDDLPSIVNLPAENVGKTPERKSFPFSIRCLNPSVLDDVILAEDSFVNSTSASTNEKSKSSESTKCCGEKTETVSETNEGFKSKEIGPSDRALLDCEKIPDFPCESGTQPNDDFGYTTYTDGAQPFKNVSVPRSSHQSDESTLPQQTDNLSTTGCSGEVISLLDASDEGSGLMEDNLHPGAVLRKNQLSNTSLKNDESDVISLLDASGDDDASPSMSKDADSQPPGGELHPPSHPNSASDPATTDEDSQDAAGSDHEELHRSLFTSIHFKDSSADSSSSDDDEEECKSLMQRLLEKKTGKMGDFQSTPGATTQSLKTQTTLQSTARNADVGANIEDDNSGKNVDFINNNTKSEVDVVSSKKKEKKSVKPKKPKLTDEEKNLAMYNAIRSNDEIYSSVLQYKPVYLSRFKILLDENQIKVSAQVLLDFLDSQGITFSTADENKAPRQKRRKVKK